MRTKNQRAIYMRNFVFGGEDSLVSTVGLLSGIVTAGLAQSEIIVTGVILIVVEALSMAVGSFLSESTAEELLAHRAVPVHTALTGGLIMFVSYFVMGFIPLAPYLLWTPPIALGASIAVSLLALAGLGFVSAEQARVSPLPRARRMLILGGLAILLGVVIGRILPTSG